MKLHEVITLTDSEYIPMDNDRAIAYMSQWDYGEYDPDDDTTLEDLYHMVSRLYFRVYIAEQYVLYRDFMGGATLYCVAD